MASFGEGLSSGIGQGMAWGKLIADTYSDAKQKRELEEAGKLDQKVVGGGFSTNDQYTADYVNNPDNGYEVEKTTGGLRFRTAGSENGWTDLNSTAKRFQLGGKTQDTEFTAEQIARARTDAMSDVYARNGDPTKALGLKALAREDRKGQQWEDINQNQINDLQALAEGKYDQLKGTIDKGIARYNEAQTGQYADGHRISVDWNKNEAIVTGPKNEVVKTIPINQQTAAQFIRSYYEDLRAAANPEFGLSARKTAAEERKAGAAETSARADVEYKGAGGVAERVGMAAAASRSDSANKPNVRMAQVNVTDNAGVTTKVPVSVVTSLDKNGVPVVQAYSLDGKPIKDSSVVNQLAGDDGMSTSGRNADLSAARKKYENGGIDYNGYKAETVRINQDYDRADTMNKLGSDFKLVEKNEGRDSAVRGVVAQIEGSVKNPKDREVVYGQLGIKTDEVTRAKRDRKPSSQVDAASNYYQQSSWKPGQNRPLPENMRGQ